MTALISENHTCDVFRERGNKVVIVTKNQLADQQVTDLQAVAYLMTVTGKNLNELLGGKK